ncbi:prokaryotic type K homology domain-containing protein [Mycotypha africana]|uniref:uncharacterized protein n=1 Tax=Mycotypha africana TaxID=64632 RepID=UPI002300157E|nr:uncharacterized protein BDF20DRAFT_638195 [Mycotypha africana]KAI8973253.1 prokaryotic type K homology domain-containing protein [Mycotypha africana]
MMVIVSAKRALQPQARAAEEYILKQLSNIQIPATLIFNKMDLVKDERNLLEPVVNRYLAGYKHFTRTLYVSALFNDGLMTVKDTLCSKALPAPWLYPPTQTSEMAPLKRVEDIIRVEFFKRLNYYLPYSLKQENAVWMENEKDGSLMITQNIYVERDSQQKIIIGAKGRIITAVIHEARQKIANALKKPKVQLFIKIKTRKRQ